MTYNKLNILFFLILMIGATEMSAKAQSKKVSLKLLVSKAPQHIIQLEVENISGEPIKFFDDSNIFQHSFLEVKANGKKVEGGNLLSVMSAAIDSTYRTRNSIVHLLPNERKVISKVIIEKAETGSSIKWGPYIYKNLTGEINLTVKVNISSKKYYNHETKKWIEDELILKGEFSSQSTRLEL